MGRLLKSWKLWGKGTRIERGRLLLSTTAISGHSGGNEEQRPSPRRKRDGEVVVELHWGGEGMHGKTEGGC